MSDHLSTDELLAICQENADILHAHDLDRVSEIEELIEEGGQAAAVLKARGYPSVAWAEVEYEIEMNR